MLRNLLRGAAAFLPAVVVLPAMAAEPLPTPAPGGFEPITLAEVNALGPLSQQPQPSEPQPEPSADSPAPSSAEPAPSPWAGTLEVYGFAPLRATTSVTRGPTERDLPGRIRERIRERIRQRIEDLIRDRLPGEVGGAGGDSASIAPSGAAGERIGSGSLAGIRNRIENLRRKLQDRSFPEQIEIPGFTSETDVGLGTILEHLTDIFYLRGSVEYNRIGFQTDLSYVGLGGESASTFHRQRRFFPDRPQPGRTVKAQVAVTQGIYDFALRYRFGERERAVSTPGAVTVIPYAGVRVVDLGVETDVNFEGPLRVRSTSLSFGDPIVQPLVGLQGQVFLSPRLRLFARGDLGGFGTNGEVDMSGNAQVGLGYAIGNSTQLNLSWRYLYLARDNGETPNAAYAIDQNGIEAGVKFFF